LIGIRGWTRPSGRLGLGGIRRLGRGPWLRRSVWSLRTPADEARLGLRAYHAVDRQPLRPLEAEGRSLGPGAEQPVHGAWLMPEFAQATLKAADELRATRGSITRTAAEQTGRGEGGREGLAPLGLRLTIAGEAWRRQAQQQRNRDETGEADPRPTR
jgi:hypothetical protein